MSNLIKQKPATEPNEFQLKQMKRKFGMFIHFVVNTFGNTEWSDGMIRAKSYQPETTTQTPGQKQPMRPE